MAVYFFVMSLICAEVFGFFSKCKVKKIREEKTNQNDFSLKKRFPTGFQMDIFPGCFHLIEKERMWFIQSRTEKTIKFTHIKDFMTQYIMNHDSYLGAFILKATPPF